MLRRSDVEGRTKQAYKPQHASLKWRCTICSQTEKRDAKTLLEASYPSKKTLSQHWETKHGKPLPEMELNEAREQWRAE